MDLSIQLNHLHTDTYLAWRKRLGKMIEKTLRILTREEFNKTVISIGKLRALGITKSDRSIEYSTTFADSSSSI